MISYELCKKLKDAGFPQEIDDGDDYYDEDGIFKMMEEINTPRSWDTKVPTLSELIEACGDKFGSLNLNTDGTFSYDTVRIPHFYLWFAQDESQLIDGEGDTPEIAVANLWLKLNEKNNQNP